MLNSSRYLPTYLHISNYFRLCNRIVMKEGSPLVLPITPSRPKSTTMMCLKETPMFPKSKKPILRQHLEGDNLSPMLSLVKIRGSKSCQLKTKKLKEKNREKSSVLKFTKRKSNPFTIIGKRLIFRTISYHTPISSSICTVFKISPFKQDLKLL